MASDDSAPRSELPAAPVVKWVGGKRKIAADIIGHMPRAIGTYYEPFAGGAAVYFALMSDATRVVGASVLTDTCRPLIETYQAIVMDADAVSLECREHEAHHVGRGAVHYDTVREDFNSDRSVGRAAARRRAGRFLYLNRACFNGMWRTSRAGGFNVPFGKRATVVLPSLGELRAFARVVRNATVGEADYEAAVGRAGRTDVVYFDPPYDSPDDKGFTGYDGCGTDWEFQVHLADVAATVRDRGAKVIASNRGTNRIRRLWEDRGFVMHDAKVRHMVGATVERRPVVDELIMVSR